MSGSSPLARGLPSFIVLVGGGCGIIPARAGFTIELKKQLILPLDHPRSRGVYGDGSGGLGAGGGSSPLARGLPRSP